LVGSGRGLISRYYPGIRLEGLRKTTKISIRIAGRQDREPNPGPPEYEAGVLATRSRRSVVDKRFGNAIEGSGLDSCGSGQRMGAGCCEQEIANCWRNA
jgi:hypothetical protein